MYAIPTLSISIIYQIDCQIARTYRQFIRKYSMYRKKKKPLESFADGKRKEKHYVRGIERK